MLLRMCYVWIIEFIARLRALLKRYLVLETSMIFYYFDMSECNLHNLLTAGIKYVTNTVSFKYSIQKKVVLEIFQSLIFINLL